MRKNLKILSILILFALVIPPLGIFLAGCGATTTNEVKAVCFESTKYDEETGYAIFEVDLGVPTMLDYKVNPSTWSGYKVTFDIKDSTSVNNSRFTFEDGEITVNDNAFSDIKVSVYINNFSDTCIVKLKEYPIRIAPVDAEITINAFGSSVIGVVGYFVNSVGIGTTRNINETEYNFTVVSGDETEIDIPISNRLKFYSIRPNAISNIPVTVYLNDMSGNRTNLSFEIKVNIVRNAEYAIVKATGYDKFISNGDAIEINLADIEIFDSETETSQYKIDLKTYIFSKNDIWIENVEDLTINLSSSKYVRVSGNSLYIDDDILNNTEFSVYISSNLIKPENKESFSFRFAIKIKR